MKKNIFIQWILVISMILVTNLGCSARFKDQGLNLESETLFPSPTPGPVATPTELVRSEGNPTQTPLDIGISTPIPLPTLTNLQQQLLLLKLNDEDCMFPCYLGINFGVTPIHEALQILQNLGASLRKGSPHVYHPSGFKQYSLQLDIVNEDIELRHSIYLLSNGDTIVRMHVSIENRLFPYFNDYWSRFYLKEILTQLSDPENIYIITKSYQPTYRIFIIDEAQGIQYSVISLKNNDLVCPQSDSSIGSIGLTLYDPEYYEEILTVDNWLVFDPKDYTTVNDILALSNQEFIFQILKGTIECFEVPD